MKESKLDVLQGQLDKFKMKDGEGVAEMYSRLALITNEITGLGSKEMTDKFIIKKILRALDGKYDTVCTLIQMMPNYKTLKPTEVIGRFIAHEMTLMDKEELHNKSSGAYKATSDPPTTSSDKLVSNEEISLMVKNFNKFYKNRSKDRSSKSRSYDEKRSSNHDRNCYNYGRPGHYSNECMAPHKRIEESPRRRSSREESPWKERRSRDDRYEQRSSRRSKDSERKDKSSRSYTRGRHQAHVGEWVSSSNSDNQSEGSYHSDSEYSQDEGVAGLALVSSNSNSYDIFDYQMRELEDASWQKAPSQVTLEQESSLLKGIIEKGVYKSLAGSKNFEEIVRKQGRHRKNQGIGFERKYNAEGVEWEEGQYPTPKFVPQKEKYDPTSSNVEQAQDDLPPQDHMLKGKDKLQEEIDAFVEAPQAMVKWVPKESSSSTSTSSTSTPSITIKMMWIPKKKN
jgi:hypothetical protein